jgi:hypothetical protein
MLDLSDTIAPRSDQLNADDLLAGPLDVTVVEVRRGTPEQPVEVFLRELDRPWKPCKTVRRILVALWGPDGETWVGRRARLYNDTRVEWGGKRVGGIRVSHLSHIDSSRTVLVAVKRGRREPVEVLPLPMPVEEPPVEPPDLLEVLEARGLTMSKLDEWASTTGRPLVSSLDRDGQDKVAIWLASSKADKVVASLVG